MCVLLSHPQQRCAQDEFDAPKDLAKMVAPVPCTSSSGGLPQLRKEGEDDGSGPHTFWVICLKSLNSKLCSLHRCVVQHLSIGLFAIPGIHILLFIYCWSRQTRWRLSLIALHMNCALHPKLRTYIVSVRHPFVLFCSLMLQCGAIDWSQMLVSPVAQVVGSRSSLQFPNLLLQSFLTSVACKVNSWPVLLSHNKSIWCSLLFDTAAYEFHLEFGRTVWLNRDSYWKWYQGKNVVDINLPRHCIRSRHARSRHAFLMCTSPMSIYPSSLVMDVPMVMYFSCKLMSLQN